MKKIILITGASSGIGKDCAELLAKQGHVVYGTSRKPQKSNLENLTFLSCDVTDRLSVKSCVDQIIKEQQAIDVIINNAGAGIVGALELTTKEEFDFQMQVNFEGVFNVCSVVIPHLRNQRTGLIINMSSIGGVMGLPFQGLYSASKFAVEGYSEALRVEMYPFNIKVVLIQPGDFNTSFTNKRIISKATQEHKDYKNQFSTTLQLIENNEKKGGNPTQVAQLIAKIIESKNPSFKYSIGKWTERAAIYAKRIVPNRTHQWILRKYYQIK